jgi:hypothetical protein
MFAFIDFTEGLDKRFVEEADDEDRPDAHDDGEAAEEGGEVEDGDDGENEFSQGVDVHETAVEEFTEGFIGFANTVDRRSAMMVLLPFDGQMEYLVVFFLEEVTAEVEGKGTLHKTCRTVEAPLDQFNADIACDIKPCIMEDVPCILLYPADEPAEENRIK